MITCSPELDEITLITEDSLFTKGAGVSEVDPFTPVL